MPSKGGNELTRPVYGLADWPITEHRISAGWPAFPRVMRSGCMGHPCLLTVAGAAQASRVSRRNALTCFPFHPHPRTRMRTPCNSRYDTPVPDIPSRASRAAPASILRTLAVCVIAAGFALTGSAGASVSAIDDYGRSIQLAQPARRVISLAPHLTELIYAAGAGQVLVGALDYSDYPPEARKLPRVGNESAIDIEAVLALKPDLIVAWPNAGSRRAIDRLASLGVPVYRSEPRELEDIATTLERLGRLAGSESTSVGAAKHFRDERSRLERSYSGRATVRVFYEVWDRPLQTINGAHVISKVIRLCGGRNVFDDQAMLAPEISTEAVIAADPEMIVASGVDSGRPHSLDQWRAFRAISATAQGNLYSIPADLIQRQTPRLLAGAARLCEIIDEVRRKQRAR